MTRQSAIEANLPVFIKKYDTLERKLSISIAKTANLVKDNIRLKEEKHKLTMALRESDKLIKNLVREGAISEESIFTRQVLNENEKALR